MRGLGLFLGLSRRRRAVVLPAITTVTPNPVDVLMDIGFTLGADLSDLAGATVQAISGLYTVTIPYDATMTSGWWFSGTDIRMDGPASPTPALILAGALVPYDFIVRFTKGGVTVDSPTINAVGG